MKRHGFTLIELMLACAALFILVQVFVYGTFVCLKNWSYQNQRFELTEPLVWAFENLSQDLRNATDITRAENNRITFTISPYENIDYTRVLNSGVYQLYRTYTLATTPNTITYAGVAKNINISTAPASPIIFQYYDANGTLMTTPVAAAQLVNICSISITISTRSTPAVGTGAEAVVFRTEVRPRNLGS